MSFSSLFYPLELFVGSLFNRNVVILTVVPIIIVIEILFIIKELIRIE